MRTVFAGGRVFDGTGAAVAEADVAVVDGRIDEVGVGLDGDEQVDVGGSTLLPGLFDTHVHVMFGHVDFWRLMQEPFSYRFYDAIRNLDATLRLGITTVRDAGGADLGVKQALEEGIIAGPRVQISITMLSQTGGHGDGWLPSGAQAEVFPAYPGAPGSIVDGPDEIRRKVRELVRAGAEVIKIATSGGVLSPRDKPQQPGFDVDEIEAIPEVAVTKAREVIEAHRDSFRRAVEAGVKVAMGTDAGVVPHGTNLEELQLMANGGMSPEDVLVATTRTAAELMGLSSTLGTIEPGKRADLVVVSGDPFDFSDLAVRIERVYQDGVLVAGAAPEPVAAAV